MRKAGDMRNIGPVTRRRLAAIGVHTLADLRAMGSVAAYARMRFENPHGLSLNALYGLEAAILDIDWRALTPETKAALRAAAVARK